MTGNDVPNSEPEIIGTLVRSDAVEKELPQIRFEKMMRKHLLLNR